MSYLVKNLSLTALVDWLNETYLVKKSGERFSISDVQGYLKRGSLPIYLGGHMIEKDSHIVKGVNSYNVVNNQFEDEFQS